MSQRTFAMVAAAAALASTAALAFEGGAADSRHDRAVGLILIPRPGNPHGPSGCTGTLIGRQVVLTAAHCIGHANKFYTGAAIASVSATAVTGMTGEYVIDAQVPYPRWNRTSSTCQGLSNGDFGLLHLARPVDGNIPSVGYRGGRIRRGQHCDGIGFGDHATPAGVSSGAKRRATEVVQTDRNTPTITVAYHTGIADHGDSGGPLYCGREGNADYVYGVVSRHCDGEGPGHRVELYSNMQTPGVIAWIDSTVRGWNSRATVATARKGKAKKATPRH